MTFDADAYRAATRPWSIKLQGRVFVARPVSSDQVVAYFAAQARAAADADSQYAQRDAKNAFHTLLRQLFPWRLGMWWRGDPVHLIDRLDPKTRSEALKDFFSSLGVTNPPTPRMTGTGSPS